MEVGPRETAGFRRVAIEDHDQDQDQLNQIDLPDSLEGEGGVGNCSDGSGASRGNHAAGGDAPLRVTDGLLGSVPSIDAERIVQELVDDCGFGAFNRRLFLVCGIGWAADVCEIFASGLLLPALSSHFSLDKSMAGLAPAMTMLGMLLGSWVWGGIGDVVGRRPVFFCTALLTFFSALGSAASPTYSSYVTARFLMGCFLGGNLPVGFALFLEFTPLQQREQATIWLTGFSVVGTLTSTATGALMLRGSEPDWRAFVAALGLLSAMTACLIPFVPESPRFLVLKGRYEECIVVLQNVAQTNGVALQTARLEALQAAYQLEKERQSLEFDGSHQSSYASPLLLTQLWLKFLRLFQGPGMMARTFLMVGIWLFSGFGFYSFATWAPTMMKDTIGEDAAYRIITITTVFQFLSLWMAIVASGCLGPALALALFLGLNSLAIFLFWLLPGTEAMGFLAYGIFNAGSAGFFAILYLLTNLCYETSIRTTGFGFCTAASRIGGILAPVFGGFLYEKMNTAACTVFALAFFISSLMTLLMHRKTAATKEPLS